MTFCCRAESVGSLPMAHRKRKSEVTGFRREKGLFVRQLDKKRQKTRLRSVFPIWVGKKLLRRE